jgi:hypothetical protein
MCKVQGVVHESSSPWMPAYTCIRSTEYMIPTGRTLVKVVCSLPMLDVGGVAPLIAAVAVAAVIVVVVVD